MNAPDAPVMESGAAVDHGVFRVVPLAPLVGARSPIAACERLPYALKHNLASTHYGVSGDSGAERLLHRVSAWSPGVRPSLDPAHAVRELPESGT